MSNSIEFRTTYCFIVRSFCCAGCEMLVMQHVYLMITEIAILEMNVVNIHSLCIYEYIYIVIIGICTRIYVF